MPNPTEPATPTSGSESRKQVSSRPVRKPRELLREAYDSIRRWFDDLINLEDGLDREGTIVAIRNSKRMRGANAWLLVASIFVASIGLDQNSDAVIIGAMLISPLMSPILGLGLAVGTNDKESLFVSMRHFGIAILIAVVTSMTYFLITPLGQITDAIDARTEPTLLDCLVAIFGGLAGIVSASRKDKGSAIPGVAIATALMPPLCVTGFGLAKGDWTIALNSFYLFFLNSFFIALTTYVMVRFLRFPYKRFMDPSEARRTTWIITAFTLLIMTPSVIILFNVFQERQQTRQIQSFIKEYFGPETPTHCLGYQLLQTDTTKKLVLELFGQPIPEDSLDYLYAGLERRGLEDIQLSIFQDPDVGLDQLKKMERELLSLGNIANEMTEVKKVKTDQEKKLEELQLRLEKLKEDSIAFLDYTSEIEVLFPNIQRMGFARSIELDDDKRPVVLPTFLVQWDGRISRYTRRQEEGKLRDYLKLRIDLDTLQLVNY